MELLTLSEIDYVECPTIYEAVNGYVLVLAGSQSPSMLIDCEECEPEEEEFEDDEVYPGPPVDGRPGEHPGQVG